MDEKDRTDKAAKAAKGSIREAIGMLVGDDKTRDEGAAEKAKAEADLSKKRDDVKKSASQSSK